MPDPDRGMGPSSSRVPCEEPPGPMPEPSRLLGAHEPQLELLRRAQAGDDAAREAIVNGNLRLVRHIVRRYASYAGHRLAGGVEPDDLFQIGCIGLLKAIAGFDCDRGWRFSTYAVPVIIGEIRRYLRYQQPLKVSRTLQQLAQRLESERERFTQQFGRAPTVDELAERLNLTREEVAAAEEASRPPLTLDGASKDGDGAELGQQVGASDAAFARIIDSLALQQALSEMDEWDRRLLTLRYVEQKPQTETARLLGVSQAHVSRAERRLLARLRGRLT